MGLITKEMHGFSENLYESKITPIDIIETFKNSDLREDVILQTDNSRFILYH